MLVSIASKATALVIISAVSISSDVFSAWNHMTPAHTDRPASHSLSSDSEKRVLCLNVTTLLKGANEIKYKEHSIRFPYASSQLTIRINCVNTTEEHNHTLSLILLSLFPEHCIVHTILYQVCQSMPHWNTDISKPQLRCSTSKIGKWHSFPELTKFF